MPWIRIACFGPDTPLSSRKEGVMKNGVFVVLLLITMIGAGWAQTTIGQTPATQTPAVQTPASQPPEDTPQTTGSHPAAPAFGQDNPAPQATTNPPLSGLDEPVFEPGSDIKNYIQPGVQVSESMDTNAAGDFSNAHVRSVTRLLGSLAAQRIWGRNDAGLEYVG